MRTAVRFPARVSLEQILDGISRDPDFKQMVTRWERIPPRRASYADFPAWMDGRISATLRRRGILSLYSHQADALRRRTRESTPWWSRRLRAARPSATTC